MCVIWRRPGRRLKPKALAIEPRTREPIGGRNPERSTAGDCVNRAIKTGPQDRGHFTSASLLLASGRAIDPLDSTTIRNYPHRGWRARIPEISGRLSVEQAAEFVWKHWPKNRGVHTVQARTQCQEWAGQMVFRALTRSAMMSSECSSPTDIRSRP